MIPILVINLYLLHLQLSADTDNEDVSGTNERTANEVVDSTWSSTSFEPRVEPFDDFSAGINMGTHLNKNSKEVDYFLYFMDFELVNLIAQQTNRFHNFFVLNTDLRVYSRLKRWYDVTVPELYIFFTITMLMTRNKHLRIEEHWSTDPLLFAPIFGNLMSRNRYCTILGLMHFSNQTVSLTHSCLNKIEPVLNHAKEKYKGLMTPYKNLCIDESIVPFKGRLSIKQYLPKKRNRFGIKLFVLCDVKTGIIVDFIVYCGANTAISDPANLGVGGAVVTTLMRDFIGSKRHLYIDNWYTSPKLLEYLYSNKIYACGTVKPNRSGMPPLKEKLARGEVVSKSREPLMALKWKDKKDIFMLTTIHKSNMGPSLKEDRNTGLPVMKPMAVLDYCQNMGTVDTADMMMSSLQCIRKSVKWYKKLFFHVVDMHLLNAFYCFRHSTNKTKASFANFQLCVVRQLIEKFNNEQILSKPSSTIRSKIKNPLRKLPGNAAEHLPSLNIKYQRCKLCAQTKKRKETRYSCAICNVNLCAAPCFQDYHK